VSTSRLHSRLTGSLLVCLGAALVCASCSAPPQGIALDLLQPCTSDQGPSDGYCGTYDVAENPAEPDGRKIALKIVVLPALNAKPQPDPLFFLAGGPGQAAASMASTIAPLFRDVRRQRDVVLVDQRGAGESNRLNCKFYEDEDAIEDPPPLTAADVRKSLDSLDADPRFYTTSKAMDDLDRVREWLGYDRINAMGGSYGTRAALIYLKQYPDRVRSVILDGVAPPDMALPLDFPRDSQRALDKLMEACAASAGCQERYPGLADTLTALLTNVEKQPRKTTVRHPRTGEPLEIEVTRRMIALTLVGALYSPLTGSLVPLATDRAADGDFAPLVALTLSNEGLADDMANAMFLAVTCSEDYPRITDDEIEAAAAGTFARRDIFDSRWQACAFWPRGEVDGSFYEPVASDTPALILSGEIDPVTPPEWGERVAKHLSNSRHLIAPATGHGVMATGCGMRLIAQFLDEGSAAGLDPSCLDSQQRPAFFLNYSGPYPAKAKEPEE
jgi:pimeloyl-ACP methyl ester carboxylesterase